MKFHIHAKTTFYSKGQDFQHTVTNFITG